MAPRTHTTRMGYLVTNQGVWATYETNDNAQHGTIVGISGHGLCKPIEIAIIRYGGGGAGDGYQAIHFLPAKSQFHCEPTGKPLSCGGATPEQAVDNLGKIIADCWDRLKNRQPEELEPDEILQRQYLSTLFL